MATQISIKFNNKKQKQQQPAAHIVAFLLFFKITNKIVMHSASGQIFGLYPKFQIAQITMRVKFLIVSCFVLKVTAFSTTTLTPSRNGLRTRLFSYGTTNDAPEGRASILSIAKSLQTAFIAGSVLSGFSSVAYADDELTYTTTESGLKYYDVKIGEGDVPLPGETVRVHYTGWLDSINGEKKFDSSYDRRSPLSFKVGARQVIAGWDEGILTNLKVGGKRYLIIPAELGYGSRGAGGVIPPGATLYFTVELMRTSEQSLIFSSGRLCHIVVHHVPKTTMCRGFSGIPVVIISDSGFEFNASIHLLCPCIVRVLSGVSCSTLQHDQCLTSGSGIASRLMLEPFGPSNAVSVFLVVIFVIWSLLNNSNTSLFGMLTGAKGP
eukprot:gene296-531_t